MKIHQIQVYIQKHSIILKSNIQVMNTKNAYLSWRFSPYGHTFQFDMSVFDRREVIAL